MSRRVMRSLSSIVALFGGAGILGISLVSRDAFFFSLVGGAIALFGLLALLGFNVWRRTPLDPDKDSRGEKCAEGGLGMSP
jgi:hypothetical protein